MRRIVVSIIAVEKKKSGNSRKRKIRWGHIGQLIDSMVAEHLRSHIYVSTNHKTKLPWTLCVHNGNGLTSIKKLVLVWSWWTPSVIDYIQWYFRLNRTMCDKIYKWVGITSQGKIWVIHFLPCEIVHEKHSYFISNSCALMDSSCKTV